ncbi:MAG: DUF1080 domain-containing protein [Planctomycetia bacterium]|nr:DUF1080 domain-containing protein [Planctomycetia bacterium]
MARNRLRILFAFCTIVCGAWSDDLAWGQQAPVPTQKKPGAIAPAEKLGEGTWEEIDQRLIFLMVRLANLEASLDAVENAIGHATGKRNASLGAAKRADLGNEIMDRKGGGPMKWSEFYGRTAEKFFYHPVDAKTSYHTVTVLNPQAGAERSGIGGNSGVPQHQRPPQFDYIYRANESAKARAEQEASEMRGKVDVLLERRQRLEAEQAGLWCEVAFRAVSHYDLDKKPLYRFEPLIVDATTASRQQANTVKAASTFMRLALSIIEEAQKDQAATFSKIKPAVAEARQTLSDEFLRLAVDATDRTTAEGRFALLAKRLDDIASNLSDSYVVAIEGDQAKDQQRKDTFRALLQESLVGYAQIILALDEMSTEMKNDWKIKPDVEKPLRFLTLDKVTALPLVTLPKETAPIGDSPAMPDAPSEGTSLTNAASKRKWRAERLDLWTIENDEIASNGGFSKKYDYCFFGGRTFDDFELNAEVQYSVGGNGGFILRSGPVPRADGHITGYEVQAHGIEVASNYTGSIYKFPMSGKNSVVYLTGAGLASPNNWFKVRIVVKATKITVYIDGRQVAAYDDQVAPIRSGYIGLQASQTGSIRYKNIRVKPL